MEVICRICFNNKNNITYIFSEMFFGTKKMFPYFQCSNCGCIQIKDIPENMSEYYPGNYYSFDSNPEELYKKRNLGEKFKQKLIIFRDQFNLFKKGLLGSIIQKLKPNQDQKINSLKQLRLNSSLTILDVGCGSGDFLFYIMQLGFRSLTGIDPYLRKDIYYSNGLKIFKKNPEELVLDSQRYDLIMLHHVFEHMKDPLNILISCKKILNEDGLLLIRVPISDSFAWKNYRENWIQLDPPRHLYIHSINSLKILADQSGFEISKIIYDSSEFQFLGSEQYKKGIPLISDNSFFENLHKSIFSKKEKKEYQKKAIELNTRQEGDQVIVYLIKKNNHKKEWFYQ
jgi:SAM-dependent methyltransferase